MKPLSKNHFLGKSIISINDFSKEELDFILQKAQKLESKKNKQELLKGRVMASLFFEPSTRTKDSFTTSCIRMGGTIVGFDNAISSSVKKGESLRDTVRMYEKYADVIVMRHKLEGAARLASETVNIPVINGGDGANQHPTQTMLDLFSILKTQKRIEGLNIALVGDLKYGRTVHSLATALSLYNCRIFLISPKSLNMPKTFTTILKNRNIDFSEHRTIEGVIDELDILYMTRVQAERFPDKTEYEKVKNAFVLKKNMLKNVKDNFKIMHPLPRVNEISIDVDDTEYAYYFEQAGNGVPVRQALLCLLTGAL